MSNKPPCGKCGAPIDTCFIIMLCDKCLDKLLERTDAAKAVGEKVKLTDEEFFEMFGGAPEGRELMLVFILSLTAVTSLLYLWRQHDVALEELLETHRRRTAFEQRCNERYYQMTLAAVPVVELVLSDANDEKLVEAAQKARETIDKLLAEGAESLNELR